MIVIVIMIFVLVILVMTTLGLILFVTVYMQVKNVFVMRSSFIVSGVVVAAPSSTMLGWNKASPKHYPIEETSPTCMSNHVCLRDSFQGLSEREPNRFNPAHSSLGKSSETYYRCFRDGCLNKGFSF